MNRPRLARSAEPAFQPSPVIGMPLGPLAGAPRGRHNF
jgi:hypothetical protein